MGESHGQYNRMGESHEQSEADLIHYGRTTWVRIRGRVRVRIRVRQVRITDHTNLLQHLIDGYSDP